MHRFSVACMHGYPLLPWTSVPMIRPCLNNKDTLHLMHQIIRTLCIKALQCHGTNILHIVLNESGRVSWTISTEMKNRVKSVDAGGSCSPPSPRTHRHALFVRHRSDPRLAYWPPARGRHSAQCVSTSRHPRALWFSDAACTHNAAVVSAAEGAREYRRKHECVVVVD